VVTALQDVPGIKALILGGSVNLHRSSKMYMRYRRNEIRPMREKISIERDRIRLRPTNEIDLPFVMEVQSAPDNASYITLWPAKQHVEAFTEPDLAHLIIERTDNSRPVGFVLLAGLENPHKSIEFRRIAISEKGKGYGRIALKLIKELAFTKWDTHRLWLDVISRNTRARHLYETEGFTIEGALRECLKNKDTYESLVVMSILRSEWEIYAP
jgi:diamine N-acetyltransferase